MTIERMTFEAELDKFCGEIMRIAAKRAVCELRAARLQIALETKKAAAGKPVAAKRVER